MMVTETKRKEAGREGGGCLEIQWCCGKDDGYGEERDWTWRFPDDSVMAVES